MRQIIITRGWGSKYQDEKRVYPFTISRTDAKTQIFWLSTASASNLARSMESYGYEVLINSGSVHRIVIIKNPYVGAEKGLYCYHIQFGDSQVHTLVASENTVENVFTNMLDSLGVEIEFIDRTKF